MQCLRQAEVLAWIFIAKDFPSILESLLVYKYANIWSIRHGYVQSSDEGQDAAEDGIGNVNRFSSNAPNALDGSFLFFKASVI